MSNRLVLREAALAVLAAAKKIAGPKAAQTKVAVVGGFAVTEMTKHRTTKIHTVKISFLAFLDF